MNDLLKYWNDTWNAQIHDTPHAEKRIKSAKSAKLTPIMINREENYGYFVGRSGKYETWLDSCNCADFKREKKPCKHIYRLAIELGIIDEPAKSDQNAILVPRNERVGLSETIDMIENLSIEAQVELLEIARNISSDFPTKTVNYSKRIDELVTSELIKMINDKPITVVKYPNKSEIVLFLEKHEIKFKKNMLKDLLIDICNKELFTEACEEFGSFMQCDVTIPHVYNWRKIHYYLHRKLDTETYFYEDFYELPLLKTKLPDDDVTLELIKRGYYDKKYMNM